MLFEVLMNCNLMNYTIQLLCSNNHTKRCYTHDMPQIRQLLLSSSHMPLVTILARLLLNNNKMEEKDNQLVRKNKGCGVNMCIVVCYITLCYLIRLQIQSLYGAQVYKTVLFFKLMKSFVCPRRHIHTFAPCSSIKLEIRLKLLLIFNYRLAT